MKNVLIKTLPQCGRQQRLPHTPKKYVAARAIWPPGGDQPSTERATSRTWVRASLGSARPMGCLEWDHKCPFPGKPGSAGFSIPFFLIVLKILRPDPLRLSFSTSPNTLTSLLSGQSTTCPHARFHQNRSLNRSINFKEKLPLARTHT